MAVVETRISVWEALAGRAPGQPLAPADPGLWTAVAERLNPAKAKPVLRAGIEEASLVSARGVAYTMLRSPDGAQACYLRLTPDEVQLAHLMDGTRTLGRLVAEFARICGQLAPDQVRRVVADLAGNRMLEELPVDAFAPLQKVNRRPWPIRIGRGLLAFAQGRRMVLANVDPLISLLYKAGGRLLFTRVAAALLGAIAVVGLVAFGWQWWAGEQSVFLTRDSYVAGAAVLLGLNVLALACHEIGHALATKHAGRRVPAAGFLVYFGIPSVFVDTTDVWMAGRRARLLTTAAGPATGLVLAGASALVGLSVPEAAPWCFKLSFAWYINALFNLNPFLALDGYYLVMDWLEVPNLRARGLAWVAARLRRRPPVWRALDREGRLVALYGLLAVGWLLIAVNIGYRVYVDRVGGLITGLWRSGFTARLLLVVVIAALLSPLVYVGFTWLGKRWRRLRERIAEGRTERDTPRRLDALRTSPLRDLPAPALTHLAAAARWVHPRTGQQLVFAGGAQPEVFAVVDGALEGRAPGDPVGTVRERVGAGGLVGLGAALSGTPAQLSWYTAGTTLLAVPAAAVASTLGPIAGGTGGSFGSAAEAEALLTDSPAFARLSYEDILGLSAVAVPIALAPGATVSLSGPDEAIVLASGTLDTPDGQHLGRGTLIGPVGEANYGAVAVARSPVRLFSLPAVSGLPLLLGTPAGSLPADEARGPGLRPTSGVHPLAGYPPLAAPPGPPGGPPDDEQDERFEKKLRWFLLLILLCGLLLTGGNLLLPVTAWAEMRSDRALVRVETGAVHAVVGGVAYDLVPGDEIYVGAADDVRTDERSRARVTYRGGATSIVCARTHFTVALLHSGGEPVQPVAALDLDTGRLLMSTHSTSSAFEDLDATVTQPEPAKNVGAAWYAVTRSGVEVSQGVVNFGGDEVDGDLSPLGCGDGTVEPPPSGANPTQTPGPTLTTTVDPTTTPPATSTPPATTTTTKKPPTTTTKPPTTTPADPPPVIGRPTPSPNPLGQVPPLDTFCFGAQVPSDITLVISARVTDLPDPSKPIQVWFTWTLNIDGSSGTIAMSGVGNGLYSNPNQPLSIAWKNGYDKGGVITVTVHAKDLAGNVATPVTITVRLDVCAPQGVIQ